MPRTCATCKHHVCHEEGIKILGFTVHKTTRDLCTHEKLVDRVTGKPEDCFLLRIHRCGENGVYWEAE